MKLLAHFQSEWILDYIGQVDLLYYFKLLSPPPCSVFETAEPFQTAEIQLVCTIYNHDVTEKAKGKSMPSSNKWYA